MKVAIMIIILFNLFSCGQKKPKEESRLSNIDTTNLYDYTRNNNPKPRKVEIACNWSLVNGWFPDKNLIFKRAEKEDNVYMFQKNGKINYRTTKGYADCPVGVFTLKDGKWTKKGQNLTLELRGLKISDYWYWWKIQYIIKELTADNLKLEVVRIIKNKEINPTLTWEDLMKE